MSRLARLLLTLALVSAFPGAAVHASESEGRTVPVGGVVGVEEVAAGLTSPVKMVEPPDGSGRLFIVDQIGLIRVVSASGELLPEPFLDLRDRMVTLMPGFDERGLLGLAFHPDYAVNGRLFVYYSAPLRSGAPAGWNHTSHISEFRVSADPDRADPASERLILQVDEPQFNHNGGTVLFGPNDGYLYISLGDGGGANDIDLGHTPGIGNGQDLTNLLGSILRIDIDSAEPYAIPDDNPFVGTIGRDEIFAYGLRNPYRMSFDLGGARDLLIADVGQNLWEEVNLGFKGANYGWNIKEGAHCFDPDDPFQSPEQCRDTGYLLDDPLVDPIFEYPNHHQPDGLGSAVIGGHIYRGAALPQFHGRYIFGDWSAHHFEEAEGLLLIAQPRKSDMWKVAELRIQNRPEGRLGHFVLGFGEDAAGELYVLTTDNVGPTGATGKVYRIVRPGPH
ncbi:MAG TPA: PQQ-dependent sugar dehydrogenase [Jiangellaceae bacterium]|nr:PQQ-dependent sugar dehydrogenase [Jiangellaceae bacterium]